MSMEHWWNANEREETEQDSQCTYNVTLRPVRATVVVVGK